ncbi:DNA mismatch repair protein MutS [Parabacteroides sp. AGMB00274]|uniref:DNA mismatch repair protein MutS n=1 Tax=Parabacteroides faecalis TaxID=2924040 RepID=A0ABT0BZA9_9BACT|nr:MutS family DNA mismatch repair protein [Parabacteroides faecalis]MCI7285313.1 DNA mismatch repair protein MutS [Parabacteroides sp.]MCJ2379741.1 DNA mismatch repair protein MutS [Parabacteroides faecalis]MDY6254079.1 DNA mismatch repair protein MutS [Bacteroidales bacterium]
MKNLSTYYQELIHTLSTEKNQVNQKIHIIGTIRLLLVIGALLMLYGFHQEGWYIIMEIILLFGLPFIGLMIFHNRLFFRRKYIDTQSELLVNEQKGLDLDYQAFDGGSEFIEGEHSFSLDLDLFGNKSLFQAINRTVTVQGKKRLATWLKQPLDQKNDIYQRQEAIQELSKQPEQLQSFYTNGKMTQEGSNSLHKMEDLTQESSFFSQSSFWKIMIWIIPSGWILLVIGSVMAGIAEKWFGIYAAFSFVIAYWRAKEVNRLYQSVDKMELIFNGYANLIKCIEEREFSSPLLQQLKQCFKRNNLSASESLKQLSHHIGALNQRFSLAGVLLNLFCLRDIRHAIALERWRQQHQSDMLSWIETLGTFDAFYSLGNFAFNHPKYIYPEIADTYFQMQGKGLGHPLMKPNICVTNDIDIPQKPWFLIITGANMAGKSTYLRTIGVNYLLACTGLPVCAEKLVVYPAHLVTSLRTSDSLSENESYFFAELKRLKMIIDRLQTGEKLFIILDEILKGTNSIDKQKGSLALMKQLVANQSCGIIATHDLVLGTLEQEFPEQIKNYCFEADIQNDELSFSYRMRPGIAQNMNACFLMKKMGITV